MSDTSGEDYGNFIGEAAQYAPAAYGAYKVGSRMAPFAKGAWEAGWGAELGSTVARAAGGSTVRSAVGMTAARIAGTTAARAGIGAGASAAAGAVAGAEAGSIVPGVGTLAGLAIGALAPLIIPHTPFAGIIRRIPLIGSILSPGGGEKQKTKIVGGPGPGPQKRNPHFYINPEGSHFVGESAPHVVGPGSFAQQNRAEYESGRGFRRQ